MKHDPFLYLGEISHPMAFQGGTKTLVNPVGKSFIHWYEGNPTVCFWFVWGKLVSMSVNWLDVCDGYLFFERIEYVFEPFKYAKTSAWIS